MPGDPEDAPLRVRGLRMWSDEAKAWKNVWIREFYLPVETTTVAQLLTLAETFAEDETEE
jgi:hypothetical protein